MELWYTRRALDEALDGGRYAYGAAYAHGRLHVTPQVAKDVYVTLRYADCPSGEEGAVVCSLACYLPIHIATLYPILRLR